jgi:hypothetical protein
MESKTAHQVIERAYQDQPYLNLATTSQENVIGAWSNEHSRYIIVASLTLTGEWVSVPFELLINGAAPVREWIPVAKLVKPEALYFGNKVAHLDPWNVAVDDFRLDGDPDGIPESELPESRKLAAGQLELLGLL